MICLINIDCHKYQVTQTPVNIGTPMTLTSFYFYINDFGNISSIQTPPQTIGNNGTFDNVHGDGMYVYLINDGSNDYIGMVFDLCDTNRCYTNLLKRAYCSPIVDCTDCGEKVVVEVASHALDMIGHFIQAININMMAYIRDNGYGFVEPSFTPLQIATSFKNTLYLFRAVNKYTAKCTIDCTEEGEFDHKCTTCS